MLKFGVTCILGGNRLYSPSGGTTYVTILTVRSMFFTLRHFGRLSRNRIESRRNSIHSPVFSNFMINLT